MIKLHIARLIRDIQFQFVAGFLPGYRLVRGMKKQIVFHVVFEKHPPVIQVSFVASDPRKLIGNGEPERPGPGPVFISGRGKWDDLGSNGIDHQGEGPEFPRIRKEGSLLEFPVHIVGETLFIQADQAQFLIEAGIHPGGRDGKSVPAVHRHCCF